MMIAIVQAVIKQLIQAGDSKTEVVKCSEPDALKGQTEETNVDIEVCMKDKTESDTSSNGKCPFTI